MRILLVTEFYSSLTRPIFSGGVETRTFFVAKYLAQRHQVIVIARKRKGEKRIETRGNLKIYRLGSDVNNLAATVLSLFKRSFFIIDLNRLIRVGLLKVLILYFNEKPG